MSTTSDRGKDFELKVAKIIRIKLDKHAQRNKGSHANWHRRSDIYTNLPIHIEAKDRETLKPKEWFRQAEEAAFGKTPVVAFQMDNEVMAMIKFDDLINLFVEIADQKLEIEDLRKPKTVQEVIEKFNVQPGILGKESDDPIKKGEWPIYVSSDGQKITLTDGTLKRKITLCRNGHICTLGRTTCMTKGCIYSSTYKAPKAKKVDK